MPPEHENHKIVFFGFQMNEPLTFQFITQILDRKLTLLGRMEVDKVTMEPN